MPRTFELRRKGTGEALAVGEERDDGTCRVMFDEATP